MVILRIEKTGKEFEIRDNQNPEGVYGRYSKKAEAEEVLKDWNNYYSEEAQ